LYHALPEFWVQEASNLCKRAHSPDHLTSHRLDRALRELAKRMHAGVIDFRMLVAKGVNVHEAIDKIPNSLYFEIEFEGNFTDTNTTGVVYLTRTKNIPQGRVALHARTK
jgi:hypothetical protein